MGPEHPLTIGLTAWLCLCSFLRKYSCWVLTSEGSGKVRYSFMWLDRKPLEWMVLT